MYKKTVILEIEIPVTYSFTPAEPGFYRGQQYPAEVHSIDYNIENAESAIWEALYDPGLHDELRDHAEAEIQAVKDQAEVNRWEVAECLDRR